MGVGTGIDIVGRNSHVDRMGQLLQASMDHFIRLTGSNFYQLSILLCVAAGNVLNPMPLFLVPWRYDEQIAFFSY